MRIVKGHAELDTSNDSKGLLNCIKQKEEKERGKLCNEDGEEIKDNLNECFVLLFKRGEEGESVPKAGWPKGIML